MEEPVKVPEEDALKVSMEELKERWTSFLELLLKDHPNLGSFLSLASINSITSHKVELKFSSEYRFQYIEVNKKQHLNQIIQSLQKFTGSLVELQVTLDVNAAKQEDSNYIKQIGNIPSTIDDQIEKEPIIKAVLDIFDGEILS
ncbi:MAG TPA: hypothetical protein VHP36_04045 [Chitinispirillaceae bacterium]|nr:hypothetical protein [Chitinispirillaceae bacterium]